MYLGEQQPKVRLEPVNPEAAPAFEHNVPVRPQGEDTVFGLCEDGVVGVKRPVDVEHIHVEFSKA